MTSDIPSRSGCKNRRKLRREHEIQALKVRQAFSKYSTCVSSCGACFRYVAIVCNNTSIPSMVFFNLEVVVEVDFAEEEVEAALGGLEAGGGRAGRVGVDAEVARLRLSQQQGVECRLTML